MDLDRELTKEEADAYSEALRRRALRQWEREREIERIVLVVLAVACVVGYAWQLWAV